jgi:hypothetical protein
MQCTTYNSAGHIRHPAARCNVRKRGAARNRTQHGSHSGRGTRCSRRSPSVSTEPRLRAVCAARRPGATCTSWRSGNGDGVRDGSTGASMSTVETVSLAALAGPNVQPNTPAVDVVAGQRCRPITDGGSAEVAGVDAYGLLGHCVRVCWSARCDVHRAYARTYGTLPDGSLRATWRAVERHAQEPACLLAHWARRLQRRQCPARTHACTSTRTVTAVPGEMVVVVVGAPHSGLACLQLGSSRRSAAAVTAPAGVRGSLRTRRAQSGATRVRVHRCGLRSTSCREATSEQGRWRGLGLVRVLAKTGSGRNERNELTSAD